MILEEQISHSLILRCKVEAIRIKFQQINDFSRTVSLTRNETKGQQLLLSTSFPADHQNHACQNSSCIGHPSSAHWLGWFWGLNNCVVAPSQSPIQDCCTFISSLAWEITVFSSGDIIPHSKVLRSKNRGQQAEQLMNPMHLMLHG